MSDQILLRNYEIKGIVQGVGFRPFIVRIASEFKLNGWILNDSNGVTLEVEGLLENINSFINEIKNNPPSLAVVERIDLLNEKKSSGIYKNFFITKSLSLSNRQALIAPDSDVCEDCVQELFDFNDRRYKYPFINCTNCGPRYSIIEDIPYDRKNTTMKSFKMCPPCRKEYEDVTNRRFHAQPVACWDCGPMVELRDNHGNTIKSKDPIEDVVGLLKKGKILAIKGIGGFHLVIDPTNDSAVRELRKRKHRQEKPFALLSENVEAIKQYCHVNVDEEALLASKQKPIVILRKGVAEVFSDKIAPENKNYGVMLAYTPIHYRILRHNFLALICTSANITDHPIEYKNESAIKRLSSVADYFLLHNREIKTRVDDSIVRLEEKHTSIIRRSRSYCPIPIIVSQEFPSGLALGAELKNTICLNRKDKFFISQHIGDLKSIDVYESFKENILHLKKILEIEPKYVACDLHPSFYNTRFANKQKGLPVFHIQHHHAHMASCMAENKITTPVIGITFDGVGYGEDGNLWGGEFLVGDFLTFKRFAHFQYFPLLGGDKAVKEPYRIAIALLYEAYEDKIKDLRGLDLLAKRKKEVDILIKIAQKRINAPLSCSVGRLFDGISALLGIREYIEYEGQAAIELEQKLMDKEETDSYTYNINLLDNEYVIDIIPMIKKITDSVLNKEKESYISKKFHNTIVNICEEICDKIKKEMQVSEVVLSGGVFQNQYLLKNVWNRLEHIGFKVYSHSLVPTNDGGISLGQAMIGAHKYLKMMSSI